MRQQYTLQVKPPNAGIVRNSSFQDMPPFSCFDSLNFWPIDVTDGHAASATRPPLTAVTSPGTPVNMLATLNLPDPRLFAAANGTFYKFASGAWSAISSTIGVTGSRPVVAVPYITDLFILNDDAPAVYNSTAGTLAAWTATTGTVPTGCKVGASYEGAVWLAKRHQLFSSRVGNAYDFDSSRTDSGAPIDGTFSGFGLMTEPITAMVPLRGRMVIGCEDRMFLMTGHPMQGGRVDQLSSTVGILGPQAWCRVTTNRDEIFFMTKDGLHSCQTDATVTDLVTTPVSPARVPDELIGLAFDADNPTITMAFDLRWNGIIICVRGSNPQAWWYDLTNGGFHRMSFSDYPVVLHKYDPFMTADTSGVLFGGPGYGGLSRLDRTGTEAKSEALQLIGPFPLSDSLTRASLVKRMDLVLGGSTNDTSAVINLHTGGSAQMALQRARADLGFRKHSVTVGNLINNRRVTFPQLAGAAGCLAIRQPTLSSSRLVFEGAELSVLQNLANNDAGLLPPSISPPSIPYPIVSGTD